jgi:hypothetical protein
MAGRRLRRRRVEEYEDEAAGDAERKVAAVAVAVAAGDIMAVFFASAADGLILGLSGIGISGLLVFGCTMQPGPGPSGTEPNARVVVVVSCGLRLVCHRVIGFVCARVV